MKLMIASDIHGSAYYCKKMIESYHAEKPEKLLLLGDLLYHGPRNDLPEGYDPKKVIEMLNAIKEDIMCVRGNCESEVDQMVLEFPIMADYIQVFVDGINIFATHGHIFNNQNKPLLKAGDILLHGHTHVQAMDDSFGYVYLNPGSVSIPKENCEHSFMMYENKKFSIKNFNGNVISEYIIER